MLPHLHPHPYVILIQVDTLIKLSCSLRQSLPLIMFQVHMWVNIKITYTGMWRRVFWQMDTNFPLEPFLNQNGGKTFLRDICTYILNHTASHYIKGNFHLPVPYAILWSCLYFRFTSGSILRLHILGCDAVYFDKWFLTFYWNPFWTKYGGKTFLRDVRTYILNHTASHYIKK